MLFSYSFAFQQSVQNFTQNILSLPVFKKITSVTGFYKHYVQGKNLQQAVYNSKKTVDFTDNISIHSLYPQIIFYALPRLLTLKTRIHICDSLNHWNSRPSRNVYLETEYEVYIHYILKDSPQLKKLDQKIIF